MNHTNSEPESIRLRYARRESGDRYSFLRSEVWQSVQEMQHQILLLFSKRLGWKDFKGRTLTEVGCGAGGNLLDFLRYGFSPELLCGIELLPERVTAARTILPAKLPIYQGDAARINVEEGTQDVVFQSVVFSSLLDDGFQEELADRMWRWVKPGGGVLWYDFIYNNPSNPDVRGVPVRRIRELFPEGKFLVRRVTLAPPVSRRVCRIHPGLYRLFNSIPLLRTHVLCWIEKDKDDA
ncbi:MAG TPA: class I SAM-dependent methyltransferase [Chromatiales bacterium]|nr:class I SAM-dependent methyltransferase [Chromatiales bacterium]